MVRPACLEDTELPGLRGKLAGFVERPRFENFITFIILVNAVTLGLETSEEVMGQYGAIVGMADKIILTIFCIELAMKMAAYGPSFFRAGWNVFDFVVVAVSLVPNIGPFSVLRMLRIFRVLRLISMMPQMRRVVSALFSAVPGMFSVLGMLLILFYVGAVLTTQLFGQSTHPYMAELYGSVWNSMFTLFQVMTLEGWAEEVARPTMDIYPWAWAFFVPFIVVSAFAVLNMFIGIIVDALNVVQEEEMELERQEMKVFMHQEKEYTRRELEEMKSMIRAMMEEKGDATRQERKA